MPVVNSAPKTNNTHRNAGYNVCNDKRVHDIQNKPFQDKHNKCDKVTSKCKAKSVRSPTKVSKSPQRPIQQI